MIIRHKFFKASDSAYLRLESGPVNALVDFRNQRGRLQLDGSMGNKACLFTPDPELMKVFKAAISVPKGEDPRIALGELLLKHSEEIKP